VVQCSSCLAILDVNRDFTGCMSAGCECDSQLMDGQWESRTSQSEWQYVAGRWSSVGELSVTADFMGPCTDDANPLITVG
jgi:hypothetical protein